MSHLFHQTQSRNKIKLKPTFVYENKARLAGFCEICGIDEAGRGAIAGPLVAGAVILKQDCKAIFNDSKLLSSSRREELFGLIDKTAFWGVGIVEVDIINNFGIQQATYLAYRQAIDSMEKQPDFLLIDHYSLPECKIKQKPITHGDRLCQSIAAASIVAKVTRDKIMSKIGANPEFANYGFNQHFGYGTQGHRQAIERYGSSKIHRKLYVETFTGGA